MGVRDGWARDDPKDTGHRRDQKQKKTGRVPLKSFTTFYLLLTQGGLWRCCYCLPQAVTEWESDHQPCIIYLYGENVYPHTVKSLNSETKMERERKKMHSSEMPDGDMGQVSSPSSPPKKNSTWVHAYEAMKTQVEAKVMDCFQWLSHFSLSFFSS